MKDGRLGRFGIKGKELSLNLIRLKCISVLNTDVLWVVGHKVLELREEVSARDTWGVISMQWY